MFEAIGSFVSRSNGSRTRPVPGAAAPDLSPGRVLAFIAILVAAAFAIRLWGIDARTFAHPENFAPGLDMPDWASKPGERTSILSILYGTLVDGHPPAYFLALLPWVKAFGTSLLSLRLPSALLGAVSVWILLLIGRREYGRGAGVIAAAMLAAHSYHIYWSQMTRMYVPVAFLCLFSTLLLLQALEKGTVRRYALYVLVTAIALWTQLYAWPLLLGHVAWTLAGSCARRPRRMALRAQALALVIGAPVVQLSLFQDPATRWHQSSLGFLEFGYLFDAKLPFWHAEPPRPGPLFVAGLCVVLLAVGILAGMRRPGSRESAGEDNRGAGVRYDWMLAALVSIFMLVLAWRWLGVSATIWAASALPLLILAGFGILDRAIARSGDKPVATAARWLAAVPLVVVLAFLPVAIMLAVSLVRGVYVARGTLVFVPYLLLLTGMGLHYLLTTRAFALRGAGMLAAGLTVFIFFDAYTYEHLASSSPRDYAGLASELRDRIQPGDLVLVRNDYRFPPLFYYLPRSLDPQLVPDHYEEVMSSRRPSRVWVVKLCYGTKGIDAKEAVRGMNPSLVVRVTRAEAWLYERGGPSVTESVSRAGAAPATLGCHAGDTGDEDDSAG